MANRIRAINLTDFTAGLNLRADAFTLGQNESPDMLNVEVDPRGGFQARKGWDFWSGAPGVVYDPKSLFVHELSTGAERIYFVNDDEVHFTDNEGTSWTKLQAAATDVVASAVPHGADFATWGDTLYFACGTANQSVRVVGSTATRMTQAEAGTWTDYVSPSTNRMPHANYMAAHAGYIFVAATEEGGTVYPNRLRFSHPNNPEAWAQDDYFDINEAGGPITAIMPMQDHLLIFKRSSVWALYGYDANSWQIVNVAREIGAIHRSAVARSERAVFFFAAGEGVYAIADGNTPAEISEPIRPIFDSPRYTSSLELTNVWLGWVGQRLWVSLPYRSGDRSGPAIQAETSFVYDPSIGGGSWTAFSGSDGSAPGPFAQGGFAGGGRLKVGATRNVTTLLELEVRDDGYDVIIADDEEAFPAYYTTAWLHADAPTLKKSWRRPDFVLKEMTGAYEIVVQSYRDYDEANVARTGTVNVEAGGTGGIWGAFVWGDGTIYGSGPKGSVIERGTNLGSARAVQLRISSRFPTRWGVDAIILKFIPRRMR